MGKLFIHFGKIITKIHKIRKIKTIFGLGMTPLKGGKNIQIKSLTVDQLVLKRSIDLFHCTEKKLFLFCRQVP